MDIFSTTQFSGTATSDYSETTTSVYSETTTSVYSETRPTPVPVAPNPYQTIQIVVPIVAVLVLALLVIIALIRKKKVSCLRPRAKKPKRANSDYMDMNVIQPKSTQHGKEGNGGEGETPYYSAPMPAKHAPISNKLYENLQSSEKSTKPNLAKLDKPSEYSEVFTPPTTSSANTYESLQNADKRDEENRAYEALGSNYQNVQLEHRP